MVGKVIKLTEFNRNIFIAESEKNYNNNKIKITTYKKDFNDFISELYKKILILNKYRKINQNIISFGTAFNISSNRNINFPFIIPSNFEIDKIKIYFTCDKFQYTKIKSSPININKNTNLNDNGKDFLFNSEKFLKKAPEPNDDPNNTDWQFLFLSRESISGSLDWSGAGSGQSFGVDKFTTVLTGWDWWIYGSASPDEGQPWAAPTYDMDMHYNGEPRTPNWYHRHEYDIAALNHKHYLQPTAHFHLYQIPEHNHNYPKHTHKFRTPEHEHEFIFSHGHDVENEFYQSSNVGNISIKINNNLIVDKKISGEAEFKNYLKSGINIINFSCSDKCFLNFSILANGRIKI